MVKKVATIAAVAAVVLILDGALERYVGKSLRTLF